MADTTFEEACRCPKCGEPGQEVAAENRRMRSGAELKQIYCRNARCNWLDTPWVVQVNPDGTIPEPTLDRQKSFAKLPDRTEAVQRQLQRLQDSTLETGSEIRF
jgi:hypothetical protein